jgi:hypothetical protein
MDLDELVFHPWTMQGPSDVPTFVGGSGSYVIDSDGRRYLDFSSQLIWSASLSRGRVRRPPRLLGAGASFFVDAPGGERVVGDAWSG